MSIKVGYDVLGAPMRPVTRQETEMRTFKIEMELTEQDALNMVSAIAYRSIQLDLLQEAIAGTPKSRADARVKKISLERVETKLVAIINEQGGFTDVP